MKLLPLLAVTAFLRWYEPHTSISATPFHQEQMRGEFGAEYQSAGRLKMLAAFETKTSLWRTGHPKLSSTFYHFGVAYAITPTITIELKHGSWHAFDDTAPQSYNRAGIEIRL